MPPTTIEASTSLLVAIGDAAGRSLLLGFAAAAIIGAFRVKSAGTRILAWRAVLVAALAMPLLVVICPAIGVAVPVPTWPESSVTAARPAVPMAMTPGAAKPADFGGPARHVVRPESTQQAAIATPAAARPAPARRRETSWPLVAFAVYLAVALALLARMAVGIRFGKRLQNSATTIGDVDAVEALSRAAGLRAIPRLAESDMLSVPLMLGVREPAILLPAGWRQWDADEFAAVLAHELSHVKRHDALVQRLALIHRAIFWFSPLAWWLERHLADLSEQASDEAALAGGADRTRYAETLLGFFAELEAAPARVWWHGVAMAKAGQAEKRVERILAWRNAMSNKLTKALVVGLAVCAAPVVALTASLHPTVYDISAPPAPQAPAPPPIAMDPAIAPGPMPAPRPVIVPPPPSLALQQEVAPPAPPAEAAPPTPPALPAPPAAPANWGNWNWPGNSYRPWGPRFVIVTPGSRPTVMSASGEDAEYAESLRSKIPGDFLWFEHDGKSYVIRDEATIARAKQLWPSREDFSKDQEELRKKQEDLSKQMREQVQQKMQEIRVKVPDLTAQLQKLQDEVENLNASGATMQQLGDLQRQVGDLQHALGQSQWEGGTQFNELGRQAGELGRQMGDLGRQIGDLARQQMEKSRQAAEQMQQLLDDAVVNGTAKPEPK